jgi:hypothetical protein
MWFSSVVLPLPRNPVMTVTGTYNRSSSSRSRDGEAAFAEQENQLLAEGLLHQLHSLAHKTMSSCIADLSNIKTSPAETPIVVKKLFLPECNEHANQAHVP